MELFLSLSPAWQAFIASLTICVFTAVGSAAVFFIRTIHKTVMSVILGFAGGIILAACFWCLLSPAIEKLGIDSVSDLVILAVGFLAGGGFMVLADKMLPHIHPQKGEGHRVTHRKEMTVGIRRCVLLITSIVLHNIPVGLAIGVSFGSAGLGLDGITVAAAWMMTLGVGIHKIPEGLAVSVPLYGEGLSKWKSFLYAQIPALMQPLAAVTGALLIGKTETIMPYILTFAAGAMFFVAVEELIPQAKENDVGNRHLAAGGILSGFVLMMIMELVLG